MSLIEKELEPFQAKPHWGKLFNMSPEKLSKLYIKMGDFKTLAQSFDPAGKFRNDFLNRNIFV